MTDEERGKSNDAEQGTPPVPLLTPTPPPPDVSLFDEALGLADVVTDEEPILTPKRESSGIVPMQGPDGDSVQQAAEPATEDEVKNDSVRDSVPDSDSGSEPKSVRRARITLKIPDDDVPLSSPAPPVEEKVPAPAVVVQAMRIISVGEAQVAPRDDAPKEERLDSVEELDEVEPLEAVDVVETTLKPPDAGVPPPEVLPLLPSVRDSNDETEDELLDDEIEPDSIQPHDMTVTPPPVTVVEGRAAVAESPSPPPTAPLSPSASAPPPPTQSAKRIGEATTVDPAMRPRAGLTTAEQKRPEEEPGDEELLDDEIAPASTESVSVPEEGPTFGVPPKPPAVRLGQPVMVPPPPGATPAAPATSGEPPPVAKSEPVHEEPTPTPTAPTTTPTPTPTPAVAEGTSPARPKAPPPPKKLTDPDLAKRKRRARPGWEEVFCDDFVRAFPRLNNKQVDAEVSFIEKSLSIQRGGVVLDLGCGSGQHAVELASRGYNVVGYDLSLTMLAMAADEAQERGQKINFLQGDMREMAFEEMFDGVFCWANSFGFFDEEKNVSVIRRVHRALRKGGMFLLDLINRDYICPRLPSLAWFEGDGCVCIDDAQFNAITSRLRVKRTIMIEDGTSREVEYSVRLYSLHEIGKILHEAGFKVVEVSGHPATAGAFFDSESPRLITLAVRR